MNIRRIIPILLILILIIGGFFYYFYQKNIETGLIASGTIEGTEVVVSSKVVGKIVDLKVDEGSNVSENQVIAKIESNELEQALNSAQAKYNIAKDDFERNKKLYAGNMISSQQYDASFSALEVAAAALAIAKTHYENTIITAPISGTVMVKAIEIGELASVGTPIVTLVELSSVKLTVYLAEKDVGKVKLGEEVSVSVDSYPNEIFKGDIIHISDQAEFTPKSIQTKEERTTQVFAVKIKIPNPDLKLKPGMPADAEFSWNSQ